MTDTNHEMTIQVVAERRLIGCALYGFYADAAWIKPEWFSLASHATIWKCFQTLAAQGEPILASTTAYQIFSNEPEFGNELPTRSLEESPSRSQSIKAITDYLSGCEAAIHVEGGIGVNTYAQRVFQAAAARRVKELGERIAMLDAESAEGLFESVNVAVETAMDEFTLAHGRNSREVASSAADQLAYQMDHPGLVGIPTGIPQLDKMLGGLQDGLFYVLSGRPSMGKSAVMLQYIQSAATNAMLKRAGQVGVFSLEMSAEQLVKRRAAALSGIDGIKIRDGDLLGDEYEQVAAALGEIATWPITWIDEGDLTLDQICQKSWQMKRSVTGLSIIFIDQLQLIPWREGGRTPNEVQELTYIVRRLRRLAKTLGIPVVLLHQINRGVEQRKDKRPTMSDLRGAAVEDTADVVMLLYRDEYYTPETDQPNILEQIIGKQRDGPVGMVPTYFDKFTGRIGAVEIISIPLDY